MCASRRCRLLRVAAITVVAPVRASADTPTFGYSGWHCQTSPQVCRTNWRGPYYYIGFKLINHSPQRELWKIGFETGRVRWNDVPGPQYMVYEDQPYLGWNFLEFSFNGDHDNRDGIFATTWNCLANGYCTDLITNPGNFQYSSIWFNSSTLDQQPGWVFDWTVTHELGHSMGLAHNKDTQRVSVMAPFLESANRRDTPQGDDVGNRNWCGYSPPGGLRCIYRYNGRL